MDIFTLKISRQVNSKTKFELELLYSSLVKVLQFYEFVTGIDTNEISFKRTIKTTTHTGENRADAMRVFREGKIVIKPQINKLNIEWFIKLDTLYFLSFVFGLMFSILTQIFFNPGFLIVFIVGVIGLIISILIGLISIIIKVYEINSICLKT